VPSWFILLKDDSFRAPCFVCDSLKAAINLSCKCRNAHRGHACIAAIGRIVLPKRLKYLLWGRGRGKTEGGFYVQGAIMLAVCGRALVIPLHISSSRAPPPTHSPSSLESGALAIKSCHLTALT